MDIKVITAPEVEPITLRELKAYMKIDDTIDDVVLNPLIIQAREWCEKQQNKKYITQTLEVYLERFPCGPIEFINCSPVQSIESIKYTDSGDTQYTVNNSIYELNNISFVNCIKLKYSQIWPTNVLKTVNPIVIRFTAGYEDKIITGENIGIGTGEQITFNLKNTPLKSIEKIYFNGVESENYTFDMQNASITCTPEDQKVVTADYTIHNVPETIKQALVMQVKLMFESYTDDEQKRIERARNALLGIERVIPV